MLSRKEKNKIAKIIYKKFKGNGLIKIDKEKLKIILAIEYPEITKNKEIEEILKDDEIVKWL